MSLLSKAQQYRIEYISASGERQEVLLDAYSVPDAIAQARMTLETKGEMDPTFISASPK